MTRNQHPACRCVAVALLCAVSQSGVAFADEGQGPPSLGDCGAVALYNLLALEGCPADFDKIVSRLPSARPGGYSMKELRAVAATFGLRLTGVRLNKDDRSIDRPMLVYLKLGQGEHFLVIRPVGHTGKLVQLIDSVEPPQILDKSYVFSSVQWTGLALVPARPNWLARIAMALLVVALGLLLLRVASRLRLRRGARPTPAVGLAA
jgi:hypothetical protein